MTDGPDGGSKKGHFRFYYRERVRKRNERDGGPVGTTKGYTVTSRTIGGGHPLTLIFEKKVPSTEVQTVERCD